MTKERRDREWPRPVKGPLLTSDVPAIGGRLKERVEDFVVHEIPAYEPSGEGPHYYLRVEKRHVDGRSMIEAIAEHFGVGTGDVGTAGIKDRRAITRQWVSLPAQQVRRPPREGEAVGEGIEILATSRHRNKLRTGHLRGNRFSVRLRETSLRAEALKEAVEKVATVVSSQGMPNYFGEQRFGDGGKNLEVGWRWLRDGVKPKGRFMQKMVASAVQSEVFNRVLARRLVEGTWKEAIDGDIFEKVDTGGRFWIDRREREETQRRLETGAIAITGPMPGSKEGLARKSAGALEREVVEEMGLKAEYFERFGRRGRGTRRPMTAYVDGLSWELEEEGVVRFDFGLPAGSYATVLLREFMDGCLGGSRCGEYDGAEEVEG